jgi:hypothetical protein
MINRPIVNADDYLTEDAPDIEPTHGTTVQAGWGAATNILKPKKQTSDFPTDFKFSEQSQLVRFLEDEPFAVYELHWIDAIKEGRRSFVCLGDECPLCTIAGDRPRAKFAFNILVLSDGEPTLQIMTAPPSFARQLESANVDPKRGPLSKYYWAISRTGSGNTTQYTLDRVRATDLAEEWELDADDVDAAAKMTTVYDKSAIYVSPREDLLKVARLLVA